MIGFALALSPAGHAAASRNRPGTQKPKGIFHIVTGGQTLFRISQAYEVPVAVLIRANHLKPSAPLAIGQRLFIPGAKAAKRVEVFRPLQPQERQTLEQSLREELPVPPASPAPPRPHVRTNAELTWPLLGPITSPFGPRWGKFHAGIDIGASSYREVTAAADGEVVYARASGNGLGNVVVIRHGHGLQTVYAHLSVIIAHEGDTVRQGQAIGGVGETGHATGPHLHFEVRREGSPVNPEDYLPATLDELVGDLARHSASPVPAGSFPAHPGPVGERPKNP